METKCPKRWNICLSHKLVESGEQRFRIAISKYKSKVYDSSNNSINLETACITKCLDLQIESIGTSKITYMMFSWSFSYHINRVVSICLTTSCILISIIYQLPIIFVPDCPGARFQCEMICKSLGISKDGFRIRNRTELKIVLWKLKLDHWRIEDNSLSLFPHNQETEVVTCIVNFVACHSQRKWEVCLLIGRKRCALRYFESIYLRIIYFEWKLWKSEGLELEDKIFDNFTFRFDIVITRAGVLERQFDWRTCCLFVNNGILSIRDREN